MSRRSVGGWTVAALIASLATISALMIGPASAGTKTAATTSTCSLGPSGAIKHVIYVQYDNTHLTRDNPNVPSDLEQIPALKNFLTSNGTLDANDHTILISHTAGGIMSALTGLYPDRNGITVSNSYGVFNADGSGDTSNGAFGGTSAFSYWTDPSTVSDTNYNLITDGKKNTPAPWVPYTRDGCDVGAFSIANMELENTKTTAAGDITKVYGNGSPEWNFAGDSAVASGKKVADFEGIAIHCSQGSAVCSTAHGGKPDVLPDEPNGYSGFNALFGAAYANQVVDQPGGFQSSTQDADGTKYGFNDLAPAVNDVFDFSHTTNAGTCSLAPDPTPCPSTQAIASGGVNGFPTNFSPSAAQTLGYVAAMQESGIPVTYAYIRDAHDNADKTGACPRPIRSFANGPGSACLRTAAAGGERRLRGRSSTGSPTTGSTRATRSSCSPSTRATTSPVGRRRTRPATASPSTCTYNTGATSGPNSTGEITTNLNQLVQTESGDTTPFAIHFDDAPTVYVPNAPTGPPSPTDTKVRSLERGDGRGRQITEPAYRGTYTDIDQVQHIADQSTQRILHMQEHGSAAHAVVHTPFGNAEYFFQSSCAPGSDTNRPAARPSAPASRGTTATTIPRSRRTWVGVRRTRTSQNLGLRRARCGPITRTCVRRCSRPLGLKDDYTDDGDVTAQFLTSSALPAAIQEPRAELPGSAGSAEAAERAVRAVRPRRGGRLDDRGRDDERSDLHGVPTGSYDNCATQRNAAAAQIPSSS